MFHINDTFNTASPPTHILSCGRYFSCQMQDNVKQSNELQADYGRYRRGWTLGRCNKLLSLLSVIINNIIMAHKQERSQAKRNQFGNSCTVYTITYVSLCNQNLKKQLFINKLQKKMFSVRNVHSSKRGSPQSSHNRIKSGSKKSIYVVASLTCRLTNV